VLETDTPLPSVNARYKDEGYYGMFSGFLKSSAKALGQEGLDPETGLQITKWDVVDAQEYPKLEDIDAVLLTGSSQCSRPLNLVTRLLIARFHQSIIRLKTSRGSTAW